MGTRKKGLKKRWKEGKKSKENIERNEEQRKRWKQEGKEKLREQERKSKTITSSKKRRESGAEAKDAARPSVTKSSWLGT